MPTCFMSNTGNIEKVNSGFKKKKKWQQFEELEVLFLDIKLKLFPKPCQTAKSVSMETLSTGNASWSAWLATVSGNVTNLLKSFFKSP